MIKLFVIALLSVAVFANEGGTPLPNPVNIPVEAAKRTLDQWQNIAEAAMGVPRTGSLVKRSAQMPNLGLPHGGFPMPGIPGGNGQLVKRSAQGGQGDGQGSGQMGGQMGAQWGAQVGGQAGGQGGGQGDGQGGGQGGGPGGPPGQNQQG